jgi:hypothetical protein
MTGAMITSSDDSASILGINLPQTDPVLPEVIVRASDEDGWSNPFSNSTQSAAQWTVSNITGVARGATVEQLNSPKIYTNAQLIRATQGPSNGNILQRSWNSPEVQGVAQRSGVGIVAAGIVQSLGDAWAGATGYNPVNNQYYSPLEQQQAMWGTIASISPLGARSRILDSERALTRSAETTRSASAASLDFGLPPGLNPVPENKLKLWTDYLTKRGVRLEIGTDEAYRVLKEQNAQGLFVQKLVDIDTNTFKRTIYLPENPNASVFYEEGLHALDSLKGRSHRMELNGINIDVYEFRAKSILPDATPKRFTYEELNELQNHLKLVKQNLY